MPRKLCTHASVSALPSQMKPHPTPIYLLLPLCFPLLIFLSSFIYTSLLLIFCPSVHSSQVLYQPVANKLTVCLTLRQLMGCSCYLKSPCAYILNAFRQYGFILKESGSTILPCYFTPLWKAVSHLTSLWLTFSHLNHLEWLKNVGLCLVTSEIGFWVCKLRQTSNGEFALN